MVSDYEIRCCMPEYWCWRHQPLQCDDKVWNHCLFRLAQLTECVQNLFRQRTGGKGGILSLVSAYTNTWLISRDYPFNFEGGGRGSADYGIRSAGEIIFCRRQRFSLFSGGGRRKTGNSIYLCCVEWHICGKNWSFINTTRKAHLHTTVQ